MNRRTLMSRLLGAVGATWALTACLGPTRKVIDKAGTSYAGNLVPQDEDAEQLFAALEHLENRYYTEEGTAMILACENLSSISAEQPANRISAEMNQRFYAGFQHYAELLLRLETEPVTADVAAIVELLAYRELAALDGEET